MTEYKKSLYKILSNKFFLIGLVVVAILGYSFALTHVSIGVDDTGFMRYYEHGMDIKLGRFFPVLLYQGFHLLHFNPFWLDMMAVLLLMASSILLCVFVKKITKERFSDVFYFFLATIFLSYPLINEIFIYMTTSLLIGLGYFLVVLAMIFCYEGFEQKKKLLLVVSIFCLGCAISIYESFAQVFLLLLFLTLYLSYFVSKEKVSWKQLLIQSIQYIMILGVTVVLGKMIVYIYWHLRHTDLSDAKNIAANTVYWFTSSSMVDKIISFFTSMKVNYLDQVGHYLPITIFAISILVGVMNTIVVKSKNKSKLIVLFILITLSNFALSILLGISAPHRTLQSVSIYIAFFLSLTYEIFSKKHLKILVCICLGYLVIMQTNNLNKWFYNDYIRYDEEKNIIRGVAYELKKEYANMPVVFTGKVELSNRIKQNQTNGSSIINWGMVAFGEDATELYHFFEMEGFLIPRASHHHYLEAQKISESLPKYPEKGSIVQQDDYVIVHF